MRLFCVIAIFTVAVVNPSAYADDKPDLDKGVPQKYTPPQWPQKVIDELKKLGDAEKNLKAFKAKGLPKKLTDLDFKVETFDRGFAYQTHWEDGDDVYVLILPDLRTDKKNPNAEVYFSFSVTRKKGADGVEMDYLRWDGKKKEFLQSSGDFKILGTMIRDPKTFQVVGRNESRNIFVFKVAEPAYIVIKFTK